ncbi:hypothetical protein ACM55I_13745 [Flavobacterium sp. GB2R13]|uniref:hypothetical protein n=1 Tax=Flavobacterium algoris TaxID=3398733 RepID=UPI003A8B1DEC
MINEKGNASYNILYPSTEMMEKVTAEADVFVFGSLACRDEVTRTTLNKLLGEAKYKIFDVNLRAPYWGLQSS